MSECEWSWKVWYELLKTIFQAQNISKKKHSHSVNNHDCYNLTNSTVNMGMKQAFGLWAKRSFQLGEDILLMEAEPKPLICFSPGLSGG